ncbi:MAG TPA: restriction endonuclease subunit S [Selenomonadales bacterium]|nr:restriction endonuclease subunit S [Selenomonadales bacterium]
MGLTKQKLGKFIERVERRNSDLKYGIDDVRGISNTKEIQSTKADISDRSFSRFQIVEAHEFVFNRRTTRMGEKLGLGYNNVGEVFIVTEDYVVFRVADESILLPDYLNVFFRRPEFDRYARWDSWGSATEFFNWEEMCDVPITLPPLPVQQKYVDVYNSMLANQRAYESGLENLKLTCDAYIERLRRELPHTAIGKYIEQSDERNTLGLDADSVRGLSTSKAIISTKADLDGVGLGSYKTLKPEQIAYVPDTSRRGEKISLGFNTTDHTYLVSSISTVFGTKVDKLLPAYLMMFFSRSEFDRYTRFHSWGSARETFSWDDMLEVKIPIPDIEVQQSIINIYNAYIMRREINEKMKAQIKDICPILIKGSLEEASA